jgi:hypothetical protein
MSCYYRIDGEYSCLSKVIEKFGTECPSGWTYNSGDDNCQINEGAGDGVPSNNRIYSSFTDWVKTGNKNKCNNTDYPIKADNHCFKACPDCNIETQTVKNDGVITFTSNSDNHGSCPYYLDYKTHNCVKCPDNYEFVAQNKDTCYQKKTIPGT